MSKFEQVGVGVGLRVLAGVVCTFGALACGTASEEESDGAPGVAPNATADDTAARASVENEPLAGEAHARDSAEEEAAFEASEPPVEIEIVESEFEGIEAAEEGLAEAAIELDEAAAPTVLGSELGTLKAALAAPSCVDRFGVDNAATVINNCGSTVFVKVLFAFGRDSSCTAIGPGQVFTFTSGILASFDGVESC